MGSALMCWLREAPSRQSLAEPSPGYCYPQFWRNPVIPAAWCSAAGSADFVRPRCDVIQVSNGLSAVTASRLRCWKGEYSLDLRIAIANLDAQGQLQRYVCTWAKLS
jgi:hypothetical protein